MFHNCKKGPIRNPMEVTGTKIPYEEDIARSWEWISLFSTIEGLSSGRNTRVCLVPISESCSWQQFLKTHKHNFVILLKCVFFIIKNHRNQTCFLVFFFLFVFRNKRQISKTITKQPPSFLTQHHWSRKRIGIKLKLFNCLLNQ